MPCALSRTVLWRGLLLALAALWVGFSRAAPGETTQGRPPQPRVGFPAPAFSLPTASGDTVTLSDLRGQVVVLNFWASWCPPCRAELPTFNRVAQAYARQGVVLLALNVTAQDSRQDALTLARSLNLQLPILWDDDGTAERAYQIQLLPTTFFIDRQGVIRDIVLGGPLREASLRTRLERLLGGP